MLAIAVLSVITSAWLYRRAIKRFHGQARGILDLTLGRLTRYDRLEVEKEIAELRKILEDLDAIVADEALLRKVVSDVRMRGCGELVRRVRPYACGGSVASLIRRPNAWSGDHRR